MDDRLNLGTTTSAPPTAVMNQPNAVMAHFIPRIAAGGSKSLRRFPNFKRNFSRAKWEEADFTRQCIGILQLTLPCVMQYVTLLFGTWVYVPTRVKATEDQKWVPAKIVI